MNTVTINLDNTNTNISTEPIQYNIHAIIDLSEIYIPSTQIETYRIFIQTSINIPIIKNNQTLYTTISLFNYYNISDIINNTISQYGYYEGFYDNSSKIIANSNLFIYKTS